MRVARRKSDVLVMVRVVDRGDARFLECVEPIAHVDDALVLVSACAEHRSTRVLIAGEQLPDAFFDLSSRFAGELLQKLQNYRIRAAAVFRSDADYSDRFKEFLSEARSSHSFRAFEERAKAEAWLCSL